MKRITIIGFITISLLLYLGCGEDSSGPTAVVSPDVENATLATGVMGSFGRVGVEGLPSSKNNEKAIEYTVSLSTEGGDGINLKLDSDDEGWYFNAPLHTVSPNDGGHFDVVISDGEASSAVQDLEVEALPTAPGAFMALVNTLRVHLEQRAEFAGTSIAELKAISASEIDDTLFSLKLSQSYLDSDLDDNDLTDLVTNSDGFLSADEAELLDRMFGYFDLEALLQMQIDAWPVDQASHGLVFTKGENNGLQLSILPEIETALQLSKAMIYSRVAEIGSDPNSEAGAIMKNGANEMAALTVAPVFSAPAGVGAALLAAVQGSSGAIAGLLPSYFVSLEAEVADRFFNEDSVATAHYENVIAVAASTGWSADESIAAILINSLGAYLSQTEKLQILESNALRDLAGLGLGAAASELFDDTGIVAFAPQDWTIDITSNLYCTATSLSHKFEVDIATQTVTPKEAGADQLRVAAQASKFGGREIHTDVFMEVKQIIVRVEPDEILVSELGETLTINAELINADLQTLLWLPSSGTWDDNIGSETTDRQMRPFIAPASADDYPVLISIESLSRNGARSSGLPARVGYVTIRYGGGQLVVSPQVVCVVPGETQQFTADVIGRTDEYTVIWSVEGDGSIDADGLYQSGSGNAGDVTITAQIENEEDVSDTAIVKTVGCECYAEISVGGGASWEGSTSKVAYLDYGSEYFGYEFHFDVGNSEGSPHFSISVQGIEKPRPQPGDTGTWRALLTYTHGESEWVSDWYGWDDETNQIPSVSVTIDEITENSMRGRFHGNVFQFNGEAQVSAVATVEIEFQARNWLGGVWPCD